MSKVSLISGLGQPEATKIQPLVDRAATAAIYELEVHEAYLGSKIGNARSP